GGDAFAVLERTVKQAFVKAEAERRAALARRAAEAGQPFEGDRPPPSVSRITPRAPGSASRRAIVGYLIEWPSLLLDPEVEEVLCYVDGPSALTVAALRAAFAGGFGSLDVDAFLRQIPEGQRSFAAERLADPQTESESQAKGYLLESANKLK